MPNSDLIVDEYFIANVATVNPKIGKLTNNLGLRIDQKFGFFNVSNSFLIV